LLWAQAVFEIKPSFRPILYWRRL